MLFDFTGKFLFPFEVDIINFDVFFPPFSLCQTRTFVWNVDWMSLYIHGRLSLFVYRVEFQNKFYQGTGYKFQPFSFKLIFTSQLEE